MISEHIGHFFSVCRDLVARSLLRVGLRPNHMTVLGMLCTVGAGVAIGCGRAQWRPWAVSLLVAAGACDILDGAMANLASQRTAFGAILDSTCDRIGDAALFLGMLFYYAVRPDEAGSAAANLTLSVLAAAALVWAFETSYLRARAEQEGAEAHGGFWQRGERLVTILLGLVFHHLPVTLWILGIFPAATVAHRLWRARRTSRPDAPPPGDDEPRGLLGVLLFRWRRGTIPFDLQAGTTVLLLVFWDLPPVDPLRDLLARLVGA